MISHYKYPAVRYLIRKIDIGISVGFFDKIRLVYRLIIYKYISVLINVDPVSGLCYPSLDKYLVIEVERNNIPGIEL